MPFISFVILQLRSNFVSNNYFISNLFIHYYGWLQYHTKAIEDDSVSYCELVGLVYPETLKLVYPLKFETNTVFFFFMFF